MSHVTELAGSGYCRSIEGGAVYDVIAADVGGSNVAICVGVRC